jgi:hypothetical protein
VVVVVSVVVAQPWLRNMGLAADGQGHLLCVSEPLGAALTLGTSYACAGYTPQRTNPAVREAPSLDNAVLYVFTPDTGHAPGIVQAGALTSDR